MIRFDLLQFLVYLTDSSDGSLYPETRFYTNISDNISHWNL